MRISLSTLFSFILFFGTLNAYAKTKTQSLDGNWRLHNPKTGDYMPATVPGVVHLDLLNNKKISDPYIGNNEKELAWIEQQEWEYILNFNADETLLKNDHIELVFEGLDTYAKVELNREPLFEANNMFRQWTVDIKSQLKNGSNELKVIFTPPTLHHKETLKNQSYTLPAENESVDLKVSPYSRKAAYQFGWDWGPRFVTCGIWRPVYLKTWNKVRIKEFNWSVSNVSPTSATVDFDIIIESDVDKPLRSIVWDANQEVAITKGLNPIKQQIEVKNPRIWNPIGRGPQHLQPMAYGIYDNTISLDAIDFTVAFRDIQLINEPDSLGTSFFFKVNGEPLFVRGANYIPQDLFPPQVDSSKYERLIKQVKEANINMLRVWGGGIYENDYFYELCDKNGILVWQDFMFANTMYPNDEAFKANVKAEIEDNVQRIGKFACVALWCGNNEIEVAWKNWGWQEKYGYTDAQANEMWSNYVSIFKELIPNTLKSQLPDANYVSTSPMSNWGKEENYNHASMHYWGVWHGDDELEAYKTKIGRFMAEYGFQSYPSAQMLKKYIAVEAFHLESDQMKNRQKSYVGNEMIKNAVIKYYGENAVPKKMGMDAWIEATQRVQAHAYSMAIGAHRLDAPRCMGTMFWQLNDCWPGSSWSIIDYTGKPKAAYDAVKLAYSPILVVVDKNDNGSVFVYVQSDEDDKATIEVLVKANPGGSKETVIWREQATLKPLDIWKKEITSNHLKAKKIAIEIIQDESVVATFNYYPAFNSMIDLSK